MITSVFVGVNTWKSCNRNVKKTEQIKVFNHKATIGWFISDAFLTLGMIGTVAGFIYMLGVSGLDNLTPTEIPRILSEMSSGMSIALYTTISGLICSLVLKLQLFNLDYHLENILRENICEVI
jgi:hypothetical protein